MKRKWTGRAMFQLWGGAALIVGALAGSAQAQSPASGAGPAAQNAPDTDAAFAGIPNLEVSYYEVRGNSAETIRKAINAVRPRDPNDGVAVDALARWQINWRWPNGANGACDLSRAELRFSGTILMPRLVDADKAPKAVVRRWSAYIEALKKHEATHIRTAWTNSDRVLAAIRASDCSGATGAGKAAVAELGRFDVEYDRKTKHGRTEGALFP
ncbi:MAG: DUF922 domain-containing Zn-dependent protease [Sphingopyxis sp.]|nr:DUF922 domain-containing Zn-dependent protease [Sphingopyxis sp.]